MLWLASVNEENECVVNLPTESGKLEFSFTFKNGQKKTMYYNPFDNNSFNTLEERLSYKIFDGNELQGTILGQTKKCSGFLQSYAYTKITYKSEEFFLYEVGFGKDGLFLCFYKDDQLIAMAQKDLVVHNFKDKYVMYLENDDYFEAFIFALIRYDMLSYGDALKIAVKSRKVKFVKTIQKELISKYDPTFIPRIKAQDGIIE